MVKLGDICTVVSGSTPSSSVAEYWDGNHIWITPAELSDDNFIIYDSVRHITDRAIQETSLKPFPEGTVILSSRAPIGKTAIAGCPMYCNQGFKNLICSDSIYNKYLYFFLSAKTEYLNSLGRGATFKEISKHIVENIEIYLPSIEAQKKRAAILEKLMLLIQTRKQQLSKLDQLVKSRFIEMFGDPTLNIKMWNIYTLGERCQIITGNTPSRAEKDNYGDFIEWIKSNNITKNEMYISKAEEFLSLKGFSKGRYVESGSLLMTCIAGSIDCIGNVAISDRRVAFNQQINAIIPKVDNKFYIYWLIRLSQKNIHTVINKSLKGILNKSQLSAIKFPFPPIPLQEQFAAFVQQVDKAKSSVKQSLEKLETLKKSLMQEYFG